MIEFIAIGVLFWAAPSIVLLKEFFNDLYFWQVKEYRFDRLWNDLRWDQEVNRNAYRTPFKFILFSFTVLLLSSPSLAIIGMVLSFIVWSNQVFEFIEQLVSKELTRPKLKSTRNLLAIAIFLVILLSLFFLITLPFANLPREIGGETTSLVFRTNEITSEYIYPDVYLYLGISTLLLLFLDLSISFLTGTIVYLTWPIAWIKRKYIIYKAKKHLNKFPNLIVVGITGSMGKTTTKEILFELLKDKYNVAKTTENYNTDIGIALSILNNVNKQTEIFIAEMGAIRKGEIASSCKIARPDFAIVTDVDVQHIGIFGGMSKLFEAKSELVENLKENGTAILSADNEYTRRMLLNHTGKSIIFTQEKEKIDKLKSALQPFDDVVEVKVLNKPTLTFELTLNEQKVKFSTKIQDKHLLGNILPAILIAEQLNVSFVDLQKKLKDMEMKFSRIKTLKGDNETIILDDTYSSNPKGFLAAVKKARSTSKKSVVVSSRGILELGRYKAEIYRKMLKDAKGDIDILITTDSQLFTEASTLGIKSIKTPRRSDRMSFEIRKHMQKGNVILLEGRQYPGIVEELLSEK